MSDSGNLFVISAPSGTGKSSLVKALMEVDNAVRPCVSHTTRAPRGQEKHGREYFFTTADKFDEMAAQGEFLEWANVHGNRYGTSRGAVKELTEKGVDVVLEIDWQGALQIKNIFEKAQLIFILPPSLEELRARLMRRGEDSEEVIEMRLLNSREELAQAPQFDYVVINEVFERALFDLKTIVHAQRLKYLSQKNTRIETFKALNIF